MARLTPENVSQLMAQAQASLDGAFVLDYIERNISVPGGDEYDKGLVAVISAFFAGMKYALENIDTGDDEGEAF